MRDKIPNNRENAGGVMQYSLRLYYTGTGTRFYARLWWGCDLGPHIPRYLGRCRLELDSMGQNCAIYLPTISRSSHTFIKSLHTCVETDGGHVCVLISFSTLIRDASSPATTGIRAGF